MANGAASTNAGKMPDVRERASDQPTADVLYEDYADCQTRQEKQDLHHDNERSCLLQR